MFSVTTAVLGDQSVQRHQSPHDAYQATAFLQGYFFPL